MLLPIPLSKTWFSPKSEREEAIVHRCSYFQQIDSYVQVALSSKWVCLVTLAISLFDLQDVCIVIGSLATLDLPMVVDLIGIYVLKGPYCTLTTTNWFLQALSVIPRGSWGDVARRFTMIRWASPKLRFRSHNGCGPTASCIPEPLRVTQEDLPPPTVKRQIPCEFGWSQAPRRQQGSSGNQAGQTGTPAGRSPFP
ncbi:hypothetical protein F511_05517 [Dorcoceras hygrometricum]|uniref:Uncharacterized protein n=1 Tax=Dorcoceras hygrometricum TaxID=472368 RepID=A0A2Z7BA73_9LAMI|nr:hypothetical protein F511_05517 [Dorcoceras hygrometricum]